MTTLRHLNGARSEAGRVTARTVDALGNFQGSRDTSDRFTRIICRTSISAMNGQTNSNIFARRVIAGHTCRAIKVSARSRKSDNSGYSIGAVKLMREKPRCVHA